MWWEMDEPIIIVIVVGFIAQMIDGALGMAYGVTSTSFLLGLGIPPAAASASVHTAEVFTTLASGICHLRFGNVDKKLVIKLLVPGALGAILGAYILTHLPGEKLKPFISSYLLIMGLIILWKAFKGFKGLYARKIPFIPLGAVGGFFDAIGGGGWGPIVTTTIVATGHNPRFAIGSVNTAEFFVTISQAIVFFITLGLLCWKIVLGLMIGGVIAAPLAALVCKKLPSRTLMFLVGILVISLSIRTLYLVVFK
jgi:hypothetical protein